MPVSSEMKTGAKDEAGANLSTERSGAAPDGLEKSAVGDILAELSGSRANRARLARRKLYDRSVHRLISLGGWLIIGIIILLISVLVAEVLPIFGRSKVIGSASIETKPPVTAATFGENGAAAQDTVPLASSVSADGKYLSIIYRNGATALLSTNPGTQIIHAMQLGSLMPQPAERLALQAATPAGPQRFVTITTAGELVVVSFTITEDVLDGKPAQYVKAKIEQPAALPIGPSSVRRLTQIEVEKGLIAAAITADHEVVLIGRPKKRGLVASAVEAETRSFRFSPASRGLLTAVAFIHNGKYLALGTDHGELLVYDAKEIAAKTLFNSSSTAANSNYSGEEIKTVIATEGAGVGAPISALGIIGAGRNIIVGDSTGGISEWALFAEASGTRLVQTKQFTSLPSPVTTFSASDRTRVFAALDSSGDISLNQSTSGKTLLRIDDTAFATGSLPPSSTKNLVLSPQTDRLYYSDYSGRLFSWNLDIPYPDISFATLFKRIWYEDYRHPEFVWQSGGGSDQVEPKFSLVPLIFGTFKATFYALVFAVPLALLAALYTSQFMDPKLRSWIKPMVELMAAVPSVVVGLIAGLWLAPRVEHYLTGLLLLPIIVPLLIILTLKTIKFAPSSAARMFRSETGIYGIIPLVAAAIAIGLFIGPSVEGLIFNGDLRGWLSSRLNLTYDQRNAIVVGLAMGFAVIPLIYTVAEDVLSSVPRALVAASLALGATRWETAVRVVLPTASPGLFAAVMLGLGRAIGETMIVLMAAGNTPLIDGSPFNGLRALSANIAVELPEAAVGSSLYRILFLTALLLFLLTFIINSLSEFVRQRLRRRYEAG